MAFRILESSLKNKTLIIEAGNTVPELGVEYSDRCTISIILTSCEPTKFSRIKDREEREYNIYDREKKIVDAFECSFEVVDNNIPDSIGREKILCSLERLSDFGKTVKVGDVVAYDLTYDFTKYSGNTREFTVSEEQYKYMRFASVQDVSFHRLRIKDASTNN